MGRQDVRLVESWLPDEGRSAAHDDAAGRDRSRPMLSQCAQGVHVESVRDRPAYPSFPRRGMPSAHRGAPPCRRRRSGCSAGRRTEATMASAGPGNEGSSETLSEGFRHLVRRGRVRHARAAHGAAELRRGRPPLEPRRAKRGHCQDPCVVRSTQGRGDGRRPDDRTSLAARQSSRHRGLPQVRDDSRSARRSRRPCRAGRHGQPRDDRANHGRVRVPRPCARAPGGRRVRSESCPRLDGCPIPPLVRVLRFVP